jgi:hypothetical protein
MSFDDDGHPDADVLTWNERNIEGERPSDEEIARRRAVLQKEIDEEHEAKAITAVKNAAPPRCTAVVTSPDLVEGDAIKAVRAWLDNEHAVFLVLSSGTGTGKTTAAAWGILERARRRPKRKGPRSPFIRTTYHNGPDASPMWISAADIAKAAGYADEAKAMWVRLEHSHYLVIDDYGAQHVDKSGWFKSAFDDLINKRYGDNLRTVITTNLDVAKFKDMAGERVVDRLRECGTFHIVVGQSMRSTTTIKVSAVGWAPASAERPKETRSVIDEL